MVLGFLLPACQQTPEGVASKASKLTVGLTDFSPKVGAPGDTITVTGVGLDEAQYVYLGAAYAGLETKSDATLTFKIPPAAPSGPVDVVLDNNGSLRSAVPLVVTPPGAPTLTTQSPMPWLPGDAALLIDGTNLIGVSSVTLDGAPLHFQPDPSGTRLTISTDYWFASGTLTVTNPLGSAELALVTTTQPRCTSFAPTSGKAGDLVTVTGTGLSFINGLTIGNDQVSATPVVDDDQTLTVSVPAGASTGVVMPHAPSGYIACPGLFTVNATGAPTLTSINKLLVAPDEFFRITGTNFENVTSVRIGATACTFFPRATFIDVRCGESAADKVTVVTGGGTVVSTDTVVVKARPVVLDLTPRAAAPGAAITINGTGFPSLTTDVEVTVDGEDAVVTTCTTNQIVFEAPSMPRGGGTIWVRNKVTGLDGLSPWSLFSTASGAPTISAISPTTGDSSTDVTITGTNLTAVSAILFGGVPANLGTLSYSAGQLTVLVPGYAQSGPITVITRGGSAQSGMSFAMLAPSVHSVTDFSPKVAAAGDTITVTGSGLDLVGGASLGNKSLSLQNVSATSFEFVVPSGAQTGYLRLDDVTHIGALLVIVNNQAPIISAVAPTELAIGNGFTITGGNLASVIAISVNHVPLDPGNWAIYSDYAVQTVVPPLATSGPVRIYTTGGMATSSTSLVIVDGMASTITGINPASARVGDEVTITGTHLDRVTRVRFAPGVNTTAILHDSPTQLRVGVPPAAASGLLHLGDTEEAPASPGSLTVLPVAGGLPTLGSIEPTVARAGGEVGIKGEHLLGCTVMVNGVAATVLLENGTYLNFRVPLTATTGKIAVTTSNGMVTSAFDLVVLPGMSITNLSPTSAKAGEKVTVTGSGLAGSNFLLAGQELPPAAVTFLGDTSVELVIPSNAISGVVKATAVGISATSAQTLTIVSAAAPTLVSFSPTSAVPQTELLLLGTNFAGLSKVTVGGVDVLSGATGLSLLSDQAIQVRVPWGARTGKISVTNTVGTVQSATDLVLPAAPTIEGLSASFGLSGTEVVLMGTNLEPVHSVELGGQPVIFFGSTATELHAVVPAGADHGVFTVTTYGGSADSETFYVFAGPPDLLAPLDLAPPPDLTEVDLAGTDDQAAPGADLAAPTDLGIDSDDLGVTTRKKDGCAIGGSEASTSSALLLGLVLLGLRARRRGGRQRR